MRRYLLSTKASAFQWNGLMRSQVTRGAYSGALQTLSLMHRNAIPPDNFTFPIALKACTLQLTEISLLKLGRQIHALLLLHGFESDPYSANALISMYSASGDLHDAVGVFDKLPQRSIVTWNSILSGCIRNGHPHSSLNYFSRMLLHSEMQPDSVTMCTILHAHCHIKGAAALWSGKAAHGYVIRNGFRILTVTTMPFIDNALINMYMECSCLSYAERVFLRMDERDVVTWTTMISGYMRFKLHGLALETFCCMVWRPQANIKLDPVMLATVMPALTSLRQGKEMHCFAIKCGFDCSNVFVATSLLHMYAEFGNIECAERQFGRMEEKNVAAWTAMITAYAKHARSLESLRLFNEMRKQSNVVPNELTFMGVLTACTHAGLVDQAHECFNCMTKEYDLKPDMHHYAAMVDVLGRAGQLSEALKFIKMMPMDASSAVWGSLFASCGLHQDMNMGSDVAKVLLRMEPENPGNFVFLSNMLAQATRWDDACVVRESMKWYGLKKVPGYSSVHVLHPMLEK